MKCGGISPALAMIATARREGWRVLLGCMIESRIGLAAAASLAGRVDELDLDAHMLTLDDPVPPGSHASSRRVYPPAPAPASASRPAGNGLVERDRHSPPSGALAPPRQAAIPHQTPQLRHFARALLARRRRQRGILAPR